MPLGMPLMTVFALVDGTEPNPSLLRIPIEASFQKELSSFYRDEAASFTADTLEHVPFQSSWCDADDGEMIVISPYTLPEPFARATASPIDVPTLSLPLPDGQKIRAIVAHTKNLFVFQTFTKRKLMLFQRTARFVRDTFERLEGPALSFDGAACAVLEGSDLLFRSFRRVAAVLDLSDYFREATNEEIIIVLKHPVLSPESQPETIALANKWMRRRFWMVQQSGLLGTISPRKVADQAKRQQGLDFAVVRKNGRDTLVFPADLDAAKDLLRFLNEEMFVGAITDRRFLTNSKRLRNA